MNLSVDVMRKFTRRSFLAGLGAASALPILAACQPQVITEERIQIVEKEVPVEKIVTQKEVVEVEKVVTVEVDRPVEVEKVVTVEVEKAVEVVKQEIVEVEKQVEVVREVEKVVTVEVEKQIIVEKEKVVTVAPQTVEKRVVTSWGWVSFAVSEDWAVDDVTMGEAFQEETGIIQEHTPVHWSKYNDALKAAVPAGVGPDVFENNWSHIQPMGTEEFVFPLQSHCIASWGNDWKSRFVRGPIDEFERLGSMEGLGNHYHLSVYAQALGQYFANLDLFKENNLELPTTWDEFVKVNDTFTANGVSAIGMGSKDHWWANSYWTLMLETAAPGYRDKIDWAGTGNFDSPECASGLELYKMIFDNNWTQPNPLSTGVGDSRSMWINKEIASHAGWSGWWGIAMSGSDEGNGEQWGVFEPPGGKTLASSAAGLAIGQVAKDKDHAFNMVKWYVDGTGQDFVGARPSPPGKIGVKMTSVSPNFDANVIAPTMAILGEGRTIMRWGRCHDVDVALGQSMQGLIDGRATIDDCLSEAQKIWDNQCSKPGG